MKISKYKNTLVITLDAEKNKNSILQSRELSEIDIRYFYDGRGYLYDLEKDSFSVIRDEDKDIDVFEILLAKREITLKFIENDIMEYPDLPWNKLFK